MRPSIVVAMSVTLIMATAATAPRSAEACSPPPPKAPVAIPRNGAKDVTTAATIVLVMGVVRALRPTRLVRIASRTASALAVAPQPPNGLLSDRDRTAIEPLCAPA